MLNWYFISYFILNFIFLLYLGVSRSKLQNKQDSRAKDGMDAILMFSFFSEFVPEA